MLDLVSESFTVLPADELRIISAKCNARADELSESDPCWSVVWRGMSLAAEQALLAKRSESVMVRQELQQSSV